MERNAEAESESSTIKKPGDKTRLRKMNKTRRRQRKHEHARQRQSILCAAAAKSSSTSLCVSVCVCASNWVTPSLSQESGHTRTFNEVWAAYYGASLSQTFKEGDVIAVHPFTYTAAHAADSLPTLPAAANFNHFLKERQLCKSVKQHEGRTRVPEEEHRRKTHRRIHCRHIFWIFMQFLKIKVVKCHLSSWCFIFFR